MGNYHNSLVPGALTFSQQRCIHVYIEGDNLTCLLSDSPLVSLPHLLNISVMSGRPDWTTLPRHNMNIYVFPGPKNHQATAQRNVLSFSLPSVSPPTRTRHTPWGRRASTCAWCGGRWRASSGSTSCRSRRRTGRTSSSTSSARTRRSWTAFAPPAALPLSYLVCDIGFVLSMHDPRKRKAGRMLS